MKRKIPTSIMKTIVQLRAELLKRSFFWDCHQLVGQNPSPAIAMRKDTNMNMDTNMDVETSMDRETNLNSHSTKAITTAMKEGHQYVKGTITQLGKSWWMQGRFDNMCFKCFLWDCHQLVGQYPSPAIDMRKEANVNMETNMEMETNVDMQKNMDMEKNMIRNNNITWQVMVDSKKIRQYVLQMAWLKETNAIPQSLSQVQGDAVVQALSPRSGNNNITWQVMVDTKKIRQHVLQMAWLTDTKAIPQSL